MVIRYTLSYSPEGKFSVKLHLGPVVRESQGRLFLDTKLWNMER